jgi:hypothetical protein
VVTSRNVHELARISFGAKILVGLFLGIATGLFAGDPVAPLPVRRHGSCTSMRREGAARGPRPPNAW